MRTELDPATLVARLVEFDLSRSSSELVELIAGLERLKNAAAALQARASIQLRRLREGEAAEEGRTVRTVARSVAAEVALARRESPHKGAQLLGLAAVLASEMPFTEAAFAAGEISEWRATLVARETACLSREDRVALDAELSCRLPALSNRQLVAEARRVAYTLDPHSVVARIAHAESDRRVTIRPAPDCMAHLSALLPVAQAVAVHAALIGAADGARATGDIRTRGQIMADTLVQRVTGQASADAVGVEVQLVITDEALLKDSNTPARLVGYGPIPARLARRLAAAAGSHERLWLRRLYSPPGEGRLVAMESTRRLFPSGLKRLIAIRDDVCRTPWCGAPIRHTDHVVPVRAGGRTTVDNGQGLCERCNQVKEAPGWQSKPGGDGEVAIRTPTGHEYVSRPAELPHRPPPQCLPSPLYVDLRFAA